MIRDGDLAVICVADRPAGRAVLHPRSTSTADGRGGRPSTRSRDAFWQQIYPDGLYDILTRIKRDYGDIPLTITENGLPCADTVGPTAGATTRPDRVPARPLRRRAPRHRRRGAAGELPRVVAAGQLRVGRGLRPAVGPGLRRLRHPASASRRPARVVPRRDRPPTASDRQASTLSVAVRVDEWTRSRSSTAIGELVENEHRLRSAVPAGEITTDDERTRLRRARGVPRPVLGPAAPPPGRPRTTLDPDEVDAAPDPRRSRTTCSSARSGTAVVGCRHDDDASDHGWAGRTGSTPWSSSSSWPRWTTSPSGWCRRCTRPISQRLGVAEGAIAGGHRGHLPGERGRVGGLGVRRATGPTASRCS